MVRRHWQLLHARFSGWSLSSNSRLVRGACGPVRSSSDSWGLNMRRVAIELRRRRCTLGLRTRRALASEALATAASCSTDDGDNATLSRGASNGLLCTVEAPDASESPSAAGRSKACLGTSVGRVWPADGLAVPRRARATRARGLLRGEGTRAADRPPHSATDAAAEPDLRGLGERRRT